MLSFSSIPHWVVAIGLVMSRQAAGARTGGAAGGQLRVQQAWPRPPVGGWEVVSTNTQKATYKSTEKAESWVPRRGQDWVHQASEHQLIFHGQESVFQLFNVSLDFWHAQRFCSTQFGRLPSEGRQEDANGALELMKESGLGKSVWTTEPSPPSLAPPADSEKYVSVSALNFPLESQEGYARLEVDFPSLGAVSVCSRVQWDRRHSKTSTVFSYAAPVFTNELLLRARLSEDRVLLALIVHGQHRPFKASFTNNGAWHHLCITWRGSDGHWAVHVDGQQLDGGTGKDTPSHLHAGGIFVVGQDQDSFGGNFSEPFVGNITGLGVWDGVLEESEVLALNACASVDHQPLFSWNVLDMTIHPDVKQVPASVRCPGGRRPLLTPGCRALDGRSPPETPHFTTIPCSQVLSVICVIQRERFQKMKELMDAQSGQPSHFMHHLMQLSNRTLAGAVLLSKEAQLLTWEQGTTLLEVSQQALEETQGELEPSDVLSLVQLLGQAADIAASGNKSQEEATAFGHHFLAVADRMMDPKNIQKWKEVQQVVNGPMVVVQTIDQMVTNLNPLLMTEDSGLLIHGNNIKLEVQQRSLATDTSETGFCGPALEKRSGLDCIEVPSQNMKALHESGFQQLTLMNTWYGSICTLFNAESDTTSVPVKGDIDLLPAVSDGTHKYIGVMLGSSVISSTVLGAGEPVSTAVHFHLQHRHQNPPGTVYDPVCAFWDFTFMPETGGSWSTKGCKVTSTWQDSTSCYCNHTTNFALLLQVYEVQRNPESEHTLQTLTFIGCGVSLCGLVFTFILFIAVGVPKSDRTTVHKNLIVALSIAELLLMCSDTASAYQGACLVVTALLHLFFMASFTWMLVEGLLLWSKVVSVNISEDRRMRLYYAIGWGCPVFIVGLTLAVSYDKYKADDHCWLNVQTNVIWAFVGPVLVILAVNMVVLWRVVIVTVSSARRKAKMLTPSSSSKLQALDLTWAATRPVLILLPVLGLTWLCGVLVHLSLALAYLFIALNAFQGLFIFLVYAVYNSEVRTAIRRIKEKRKALSFTNCSPPMGFMPSQRTPNPSWTHTPGVSSPETSDMSGPGGGPMCVSFVIKNESFRKDSVVSFSLKPAGVNQVVQLTAFKPSGNNKNLHAAFE
ncbi:adhesion G-protein coupled receptor D2 [Arapaima gigas]